MRVSKKVEYGLIAITEVALYSERNESVTVVQIAERHNISRKFLEHIMVSLKNARLVTSLKGSNGGYRLAKPSEDITLTEIFNALDVSILTYSPEDLEHNNDIRMVIDDTIWNKINQSIHEIVNGIKLSNLVENYNSNRSYDNLMYYI